MYGFQRPLQIVYLFIYLFYLYVGTVVARTISERLQLLFSPPFLFFFFSFAAAIIFSFFLFNRYCNR